MKQQGKKYKNRTVIDLFCGCGGISLGFKEAGFSVLAGLDNWKEAIETFSKNFVKTKPYYTDILKINPNKILADLNIEPGQLDVLVGGPPCQGFSLAGNRCHNDPRNDLVFQFINFVRKMKPKFFLMENVLGILSAKHGKMKEEIIRRFKSAGYNMLDVKPLYAHHFGVPQMRRRVFFIGNRINKKVSFPLQTHIKFRNNSEIPNSSTGMSQFVTVGEAISDLPSLEKEIGQEVMEYTSKPQSIYQKKMRHNSHKIYNHVASNHTEKTKKVIAHVPEGGNWKDLPKRFQNIRSYSNTWKRLHSKKPSVTIDCGHRHHFHYKANRVPTVRESARIQSFPDNFIFYGSKTSQFSQVGNAVPPLLVKMIAKEIKKTLCQK